MKYSILILEFLISAPVFTFCQSQDGKQGMSDLSKEIVKNQSNSDAETFGGYLSAVWHFVGKSGNTITLQPRIFDLDKMFSNRNIDVDTIYARKAWERNIQINIGFTPNSKNLFNAPVNFQMGFSFAVINNKEIPLKDYDSTIAPYARYTGMQRYLTEQAQTAGDSITRARIKNFINGTNSDLPEFLRDSVKKIFGQPIGKMTAIPKELLDNLTQTLPRRPLLVVDVNGIHGLGNRGEAEVDFETSFSSYIFRQKKNVDPQLNLSASYSLADNTELNNINLNRHILDISAGINIIFFSKVDFKPGISYTNILSGIQAKEQQTSWSPTASFLFKIAEKLVMAFNWSYDSDKAASTTILKLKTSFE